MTQRSWLLALIFAAACTTQRPMTFSVTGVFVREAIDLRADGTFVQCAASDDGPSIFSTRGTWRWLDAQHRQLETTVTSRKYERGRPTPADDFPDVAVWTLEGDVLQRTNRLPLRRSIESSAECCAECGVRGVSTQH
jgi:hypothetical protein